MASRANVVVLNKRARQLQYDPSAMYVVLSNEPPFRVGGYVYALYEVVPHWEWTTSSALFAMGKIGVCPIGSTPLFKKVTKAQMKKIIEATQIKIDDKEETVVTQPEPETVVTQPEPETVDATAAKSKASKGKKANVQKEPDSEKENEPNSDDEQNAQDPEPVEDQG